MYLDAKEIMSQIDKETVIDRFIYELPVLRARIDMTQDEIRNC